jgi:hypothetical protein
MKNRQKYHAAVSLKTQKGTGKIILEKHVYLRPESETCDINEIFWKLDAPNSNE